MAKAKKLPSGNWRCLAYANGTSKSFTAPTKREAELKALEWQSGNKIAAEDLTVGEAYQKYIKAKSAVLSPNTIHAYKMMADNYFLSIRNVKLSQLSNAKIQVAINELSAVKSPKTVKNAYGLLTATVKMYRPDFAFNVTLPQLVKTDIIIPEESEMQTLLKFSKDKNIYVPIVLAAFCGLREAEICALDSTDIIGNKLRIEKNRVHDDNNGWITKQPKTDAGYRYVDLPIFIKDLIKDKNGKIVNYTPDGLRNTFKKTLRASGVRDFRFHDLRHYYVSQLFDLKIPEKYIIAQVGHSSATITRKVYDHLSKTRQSEFSFQIAEHFNSIQHEIQHGD